MNKYSEIEIQIANNLLKHGYKWLIRTMLGNVVAFSCDPYKIGGYWSWPRNAESEIVSGKSTPLFQSIKWEDPGPTYIEDILNPKILDDAERRYLSAVIRPFRNKVLYIRKGRLGGVNGEYISIHFIKCDFTCLPNFKRGTMYKGMEPDRGYTLEELGL